MDPGGSGARGKRRGRRAVDARAPAVAAADGERQLRARCCPHDAGRRRPPELQRSFCLPRTGDLRQRRAAAPRWACRPGCGRGQLTHMGCCMHSGSRRAGRRPSAPRCRSAGHLRPRVLVMRAEPPAGGQRRRRRTYIYCCCLPSAAPGFQGRRPIVPGGSTRPGAAATWPPSWAQVGSLHGSKGHTPGLRTLRSTRRPVSGRARARGAAGSLLKRCHACPERLKGSRATVPRRAGRGGASRPCRLPRQWP